MIKRWRLVAAALAGCVIMLIVAWLFLAETPVTKESANKLKKGMTREEVRSVLTGRPYDSHDNEERWIGYEGCVRLIYDEHGTLVWREWEASPYRNRFPENIFQPIQWPID